MNYRILILLSSLIFAESSVVLAEDIRKCVTKINYDALEVSIILPIEKPVEIVCPTIRHVRSRITSQTD